MWIFVSHSTAKDDAAGRQRIVDLESALKGSAAAPTGHDVLVDFQRLEPGAKWRTDIDEWMATCHAAVLLLTPKAFGSFWVLKEATILAHRAARDAQFLLFPVLLEGLTREQLTAKGSNFSPLYLDAIQRVAATEAAGIALEVLEQLTALGATPRTPFEELVEVLTVQLKGADPEAIGNICPAITGKPITWLANEVRSARCAREIARAIVTGHTGSYLSIGALMQALLDAGLPKDAGNRVLNLAAPLWVDAEAAAPLANVAARNLSAKPDAAGLRPSWSTIINGDYVPTFTAEMYVRRAYLPRTATLRSLDGGESELRLEELVARLREEVRSSTPTLRGAKDAKIDAYLGALTQPYFMVLPPPLPDGQLISDLQTRFPKVTFIAQWDAESPAASAPAERLVVLAPPLDLAKELSALTEFNEAVERIKTA